MSIDGEGAEDVSIRKGTLGEGGERTVGDGGGVHEVSAAGDCDGVAEANGGLMPPVVLKPSSCRAS